MADPVLRHPRRVGRAALRTVALALGLCSVTAALSACVPATSDVATAEPATAVTAGPAGRAPATERNAAGFTTSLIPTPPTSPPTAALPARSLDADRAVSTIASSPPTGPDAATPASPTVSVSPAGATPAPAESTPPTTAAPALLTVAVTSLGPTLVDAEGRTLYVTAADAPGGPGCGQGCLGVWTLVEAGPGAGAGVDPALIGSRTRLDGTEQLFYAGWPIYRLAGEGPGTVLGHRSGGQWFALDGVGHLHG